MSENQSGTSLGMVVAITKKMIADAGGGGKVQKLSCIHYRAGYLQKLRLYKYSTSGGKGDFVYAIPNWLQNQQLYFGRDEAGAWKPITFEEYEQVNETSVGVDTVSISSKIKTLQERDVTHTTRINEVNATATGNYSSITTLESQMSDILRRLSALETTTP